MNEISFRYARPKDAHVLSELQAHTFWETYHTSDQLELKYIRAHIDSTFNLEKTRADLAGERTIFLLAEIADEVIGYARLLPESPRTEVSGRKPLEISRIYLLKEFWGRRLGSILLKRCFSEAEKQLCDVIWLSVWQYNERAIAFYKKYGFRTVGSHIFDLASSEQTDLIMQKEL